MFLIRLILMTLFCFYTLNSSALTKSCSQTAVINALQQNNIQKLSSLFQYPLRINLKNGTRGIASSEAFIKASKQLLTPAAKKSLIENLQIKTAPIERASGIGLANGNIWLDPQSCKIMSLNADAIKGTDITPNPLYGSAIKPIATQLNQVIYYADINNTGSNKIIITTTEGSMNDNSVAFIGAPQGNKLTPISLKDTIKKNFNIELSNWYYFFADEFLTNKDNKVFMNYSVDGLTCTYLWKNDRIILVVGNKKFCIH